MKTLSYLIAYVKRIFLVAADSGLVAISPLIGSEQVYLEFKKLESKYSNELLKHFSFPYYLFINLTFNAPPNSLTANEVP